MQGEYYQKALIILGVVSIGLFGVFTYKEVFPEYKTYQDRYLQLEAFKSELKNTPLPFFKRGIKQIVIAPEDKGPERIDRCQSCHVALDLPHFSDTKLAYDINGKVQLDGEGKPILVKNENYVWDLLDKEIEGLKDETLNANLLSEGKQELVQERLKKANDLQDLKYMDVNGKKVEAKKVLAMHPLISKETTPFELHPLAEHGCSSCHSGNGRALTFVRAHGPLYDGEYPTEHHGEKPIFLERDEENDPPFSRMLNSKPAPELLFQTEPVLVGRLIESSCSDCHETRKKSLEKAEEEVQHISGKVQGQMELLKQGIARDKEALFLLFSILLHLEANSFENYLQALISKKNEPYLSSELFKQIQASLAYLHKINHQFTPTDSDTFKTKKALLEVRKEIYTLIGEEGYKKIYEELQAGDIKNTGSKLERLLKEETSLYATSGLLVEKEKSFQKQSFDSDRIVALEQSFSEQLKQVDAPPSPLDSSLKQVLQGEQLFISQACYSCHMIENLSKGNVGPELTKIGLSYPWYIKESIVWPQADLKTSTMPNFRLDHQEVEQLVTFLLGQKGPNYNQKDSVYRYKRSKKSWEMNADMPWEREISPEKIKDVESTQVIFATEGCASCHLLKGFDSKVQYHLEKEEYPRKEDFLTALYAHKDWFKQRFPKNVLGSQIRDMIKEYGEEIDARITDHSNKPGIIEKIEQQFSGVTESYYSNFKFAARSRDDEFKKRLAAAKTFLEKEAIESEKKLWQQRLHKVLMMYIQEYGYGREVGPNLHFSGVHRDEAWLMGHFKNPQAYIPKSIMPVMPFHESKFYALTHMLQELGRRNLLLQKQQWELGGFSPKEAYLQHCASCHGEDKKGAGVVAEMLYPIPKNLMSAEFMRKLTKERAIDSLLYGVSGTPMAAWGMSYLPELGPVLTEKQVYHLVDWLYANLPGEDFIKGKEDVLKWQYTPTDVIQELHKQKHLESKKVVPGQVEDLFNIQKTHKKSVEKEAFFIKPDFYTPENIQEGKELFILNCAMCHGKEGEGNGDRAEAMVEAKPRALTNIPWLNSRDDLRLLRSIKFGIPGTSMLAWSDRTSGMQRLQLVMYIREMNKEKNQRNELLSLLYKKQDLSIASIRKAQGLFFENIAKQQKVYEEALNLKKTLSLKAQKENASDHGSIVKAFEQELKARQQLKKLKEKGLVYYELLQALDEEKQVFRKLYQLFASSESYLGASEMAYNLLASYPTLFAFNEKILIIQGSLKPSPDFLHWKELLIKKIEKTLEEKVFQTQYTQAKLPSAERSEELEKLNQQMEFLQEGLRKFAEFLERIQLLRNKEVAMYKKISPKVGNR